MGKPSASRPSVARPDGAPVPPTDLFDRWLAHRRDEVAVGGQAPVEPAPPAGAPAADAAPVAAPVAAPPPPKVAAAPSVEPLARQIPDATAVGRAVVEALVAAPEPTGQDTGAEVSTPADPTPANDASAKATFASTSAVVASADTPHQPEHSTPRNLGVAASVAPSEVTRREEVAPPPHAITPVAKTVQALAAAAEESADVISFAPKRGARRALSVASAAATLATVAAALVAWQARSDASYAVVAGAVVLTLGLRLLRGRATGTEVSIHGGELRIVQGPSQHRFPLTASYPPIEVVGAPGQHGWKVLIQRKGMPDYTITPSMVDPVAFTAALRRFRPDA